MLDKKCTFMRGQQTKPENYSLSIFWPARAGFFKVF